MDDRAAICRSLGGDPQGFRPLVERYQRQAHAHALAITGSPDAARDAVQEAFIDAWRHLPRFDLDRPFYPWLYALVRNRCYKRLAIARARAEKAAMLVVAQPGETDRAEEVNEALLALSPPDRELLLLKHLDGLTYDELSRRLGIPPGTVMSRLHHARRRLRELLGAEGPEGSTK